MIKMKQRMSHGEMGQALSVSSNYTYNECKKLLHENKAFRRGLVIAIKIVNWLYRILVFLFERKRRHDYGCKN